MYLCIFILFGYFILNQKFKKRKTIYTECLPEKYAIEMLKNGTFDLSKNQLSYQSKELRQNYDLYEFRGYKMLDPKNVLIINKSNFNQSVIISQAEMDKGEFDKALKLIKEKLEETTQHRIMPIF